MTTMLEKATRAALNQWASQTSAAWVDDPSEEMAACIRAALQAIRDLDGGDINDGGLAALVAGKQALYSCSADPELQDARGCFHAMIDAILAEPDRPT